MIQEVFSPLMDEPKTPTTKLLQSPNGLPQEPVPCPRCDSMNTKFCYYNNYNLTQPRHFCKTCRRYWTKGGALRNVPIGGGCRKAKVMPTICTKSNVTKNKSGIWSHDLSVPAGPISWSAPHTAQLVALLRDTSCIQNPNGNLNMGYNRGSPNVPSLLNGFENLYANGQFSYAMQHHQQVQKYQNGMVPGDNVPVSSTQDMYHKIKTNLCNDQLQAIVGNLGGFGTSSVMEPVQLNGTEMGYWNHGLDLQSGNGGSFP